MRLVFKDEKERKRAASSIPMQEGGADTGWRMCPGQLGMDVPCFVGAEGMDYNCRDCWKMAITRRGEVEGG